MKKIAVIDDNDVNRKLFQKFLIHQYEVKLYNNAIDFIQSLSDEHAIPDLIILDIMMPDMTGYEVAKYLKTRDSFKHIKIIVCSALNSEVDIEKAEDLQVDDYLVKPVNHQDLLLSVGQLI